MKMDPTEETSCERLVLLVASVAKTVDEATALLENGFIYIQEIDGIKIYRKRK
jgi:hypothetical protein